MASAASACRRACSRPIHAFRDGAAWLWLAVLVEQSDFSALQFLEENRERIKLLMNRNDFAQLMGCIECFSFECALPLLRKQLQEQDGVTCCAAEP
jgi:hypothetical protein